MLEELKAGSRVVGAKQTRRALRDGRAKRVYMAKDADPRLLQPLVQEACKEKIERDRRRGIKNRPVRTMVVAFRMSENRPLSIPLPEKPAPRLEINRVLLRETSGSA